MNEDLFEKGLAQRKATFGTDYVERKLAAADGFTRPFQEADSMVLGIWLGRSGN